MEIRNNVQMNNTSFGMAFKRPSVDKMQDFVEYVGKGVSGKRAKKALTALQKQQASNHHFDIEYIEKLGNEALLKAFQIKIKSNGDGKGGNTPAPQNEKPAESKEEPKEKAEDTEKESVNFEGIAKNLEKKNNMLLKIKY